MEECKPVQRGMAEGMKGKVADKQLLEVGRCRLTL